MSKDVLPPVGSVWKFSWGSNVNRQVGLLTPADQNGENIALVLSVNHITRLCKIIVAPGGVIGTIYGSWFDQKNVKQCSVLRLV